MAADAQRVYLEARLELLHELFADTHHASTFAKLRAMELRDDPARAAEAEGLLRQANENVALTRRYARALDAISAELYGDEPL